MGTLGNCLMRQEVQNEVRVTKDMQVENVYVAWDIQGLKCNMESSHFGCVISGATCPTKNVLPFDGQAIRLTQEPSTTTQAAMFNEPTTPIEVQFP